MSDNNVSPKLKRFGKYLLLDHLVDGGMAEIYRARYLSEQAGKIVAIKMVQPQFSKDPQFQTMFMDEIKIMFGLQHPNITQTYEYGMKSKRLFTAMEYVHGKNLKEYLDRLSSKKYVFPVEISVYIISQVCQGLTYAHNFADQLSGKKLNLIHRDISPHNIMLTYDGAVKVIDFGIAKAETNSEATQAGTIKGKLSYLAPEYLDGLDLDHRYDQFAVGITLWEMLCSRKLFTANNDLAVLKKIQACKISPPSSINPNVPPELDEIVMKALSKDRNLRYENMDKFNRALVKFLYSSYPDFNNTDLSYFSKELFKEEISGDLKKFAEFGKIDMAPYLADLKREEEGGKSAAEGGAGAPSASPASSGAQAGEATRTTTRRVLELDLNAHDSGATGKLVLDGGSAKKSGATQVRQVSGGASSAAKASSKTKTQAAKRPPSRKRQTEEKEEASSGGGAKIIIIIAASLALFAYMKPDLVKQYTGVDIAKMIGKEAKVAQGTVGQEQNQKGRQIAAETEKEPAAKPPGEVQFEGLDFYMETFIDGKSVPIAGNMINLPYGEHRLKVVKKDHLPYLVTIELSELENMKVVKIPPLKEAVYGALSTANNFRPGDTLILDVAGEKLEKELPVRGLRLPAGEYVGTVRDKILGTEKEIEFTIQENKNFFLEE